MIDYWVLQYKSVVKLEASLRNKSHVQFEKYWVGVAMGQIQEGEEENNRIRSPLLSITAQRVMFTE